MKIKKGQSSLEFLVTSGLVILVIIMGVVMTWQTGILRPAPCEKYKVAFSQVVPTDWATYRDPNILVLSVENWAGYEVNVTDANAVVGDVTCTSTPGVVMRPGDNTLVILTCSDTPSISDNYRGGDCYKADIGMRYTNMRTGNSHESNGKIRGAIEEGTVTITTSTSMSTTTITTTTIVDNTPPDITIISPPPGAVIVVQP